MQKALNLLEKNVQWIALGLGALYVLYIVFSYVVSAPVSVQLNTSGGPQAATLETINQYILEGPAEQLQMAMENQDPIQIRVTDFSKQFIGTMKWANLAIQPYSGELAWLNSATAPIELADTEKKPNKPHATVGADMPKNIPPAQYAGASTGRSLVPAKSRATSSRRERRNTVETDDTRRGGDVDELWASVGFTIPTDQIGREFKAARIPAAQRLTLVLRVEAVRQEQLPDGSWGKETPVKPLDINRLRAFPSKEQVGREVEYQQWASSNQGMILQPPFYQTTGGDVWYVPGTQPPPPPVVPFDPSKVKPGDVATLTPEQLQQYHKYQLEQRQKRLQERSRNRPAPRRRRDNTRAPADMGPEIGPGFAPSTLDSIGPLAQARRPRRARTRVRRGPEALTQAAEMPPDIPEVPGDMEPNPNQPGYSPNSREDPQWVAKQKAAAGTVPNGAFDPAKTSPILAWVHDTHVKPGAVYRYRVQYLILNPLYHAPNIAGSQDAMDTFALTSAYSDWSAPVTIPPVTAFFVDGGIYNDTARFQVFHWQNGVWHNKTFIVSPGDMIGEKIKTPEGAEMDYSTDWTLVATSDPSAVSPYAIVTRQGELHRREVRADQADPLFQKLKRKAAQAAPAPNTASTSARQPAATFGAYYP